MQSKQSTAAPVTKYEDIYVAYPSAFSHTTFAYGDGNDGLVDIRFVVSRDGNRFDFVDAPDARAPWIPLGLNTCDELPAMADPANMQWCAKSETLERTSVDGAALYAAQGVVVDGHKMYVHSPPSPAQRMFLRRLNEKTKRVVAVICAWAPTGTYITEGSR